MEMDVASAQRYRCVAPLIMNAAKFVSMVWSNGVENEHAGGFSRETLADFTSH
jgi:hypothetical protein